MDKTIAELMEHQATPSTTDQDQVPMAFSQPVADELPHGQTQPAFTQYSGGKPGMTPQGQPIQYSGGQPGMTPQGQPIQYPGGQPSMTPQGQPFQYPGGQPGMTPQGQPIQYSGGQPGMTPQGQPIQYSGGQPAMNPQGQPIQYPGGQPGMTPQGQPIQYPDGQPGMSPQGQPIHYCGGQPGMNPQGEPIQYSGGQPVQPVPQQGELHAGQPQAQVALGGNLGVNTSYLKSGASIGKVVECVLLIGAWVCIDNYLKRSYWIYDAAIFFRGITIFCGVMVLILQAIFAVEISKHHCAKRSHFVLLVIAMHLLLSALMITCSVKLALRAGKVKLLPWQTDDRGYFHDDNRHYAKAFLMASLALGYIICLFFLDDIHLFYKMYKSERTKEAAANQQNVQLPNLLNPEPQPPAAGGANQL